MIHTITETQVLATVQCCMCSVMFAMPKSMHERAKQDSQIYFCCPNGHRQHYAERNPEVLIKDLEQKLASREEDLRIARANAEREMRSHAHTKGELTKAKKKIKRVENGVCPHCNRSFSNLRDHMETKHGRH